MSSKRTNKKNNITFHNQKNNGFREIHVDGALGGITPRGMINLNFFAERFPIPKSTDFNIINEKVVGEKMEDSIDSKTGIIREYEFGVYMGIETARSLSKLLSDKIKEYEQLKKTQTHDKSNAK